MPPITALLHTRNDGLRLGRSLEMLLPCGELLIVDHHSVDATTRIARAYGARIVSSDGQNALNSWLHLARHDWIFCIRPGESITEALQASLFEFSAQPPRGLTDISGLHAFSVFVRQQSGENWTANPAPEPRLIPKNWTQWRDWLPTSETSATVLEGDLLRFSFP